MTPEYRKLIERAFNESEFLSQLLLKFDLYHINYSLDNKWALAKYLNDLFRTFRHCPSLEKDFKTWLISNVDELVTKSKLASWITDAAREIDVVDSNASKRKCNTSKRRWMIVWLSKAWIAKHGIKKFMQRTYHSKRRLNKKKKSAIN